ncbi:hypothetical protein EHS25_008635 [Saitozyma podzolica]|uniref:Uncharacterized protein n=1 Tax=Saitozyma podzolica TaxID=1890683 RepID=A0A427YME0_9TREE|nr:hypothetical protein EHS25_008635 [Saitozyma podzolica]
MSRIHSRRKPLVFLVLLVSFILIHYYTSSTCTGTSRFPFDILSFSSHGGSPNSPGGGLFPFFNRPTTAQFPLEAWPSVFPEKDTMHPEEWNEKVLQELERCRTEGNCRENQEKVALFASHQWVDGFFKGWRGGEGVWAVSVAKALHQLGYSLLICETEWEEALKWHRRVPEIKVMVMQDMDECLYRSEGKCLKSESNPDGLPRWKPSRMITDSNLLLRSRPPLPAYFPWQFQSYPWHFPPFWAHPDLVRFWWQFFPSFDTELDRRWIVSSERNPEEPETDIDKHLLLPYSIEAECALATFTPPHERAHTAWMLGKQATYLHSDPLTAFAWNKSYFEIASRDPRLGGHSGSPLTPIPGVTNVFPLNPIAFRDEVGASKMMVGLGRPSLSPSPYLGLCQGTPFLNPIMKWDKEHPEDRMQWDTQHNTLKFYDPPLVYNVFSHDYEGFVEALQGAIANPMTEGFLEPTRSEHAVREGVTMLMETDWEAEARDVRTRRETEENRVYNWSF